MLKVRPDQGDYRVRWCIAHEGELPRELPLFEIASNINGHEFTLRICQECLVKLQAEVAAQIYGPKPRRGMPQSVIPLHGFSDSDWMAFSGCDEGEHGEPPLIGENLLAHVLVICDAHGLAVYTNDGQECVRSLPCSYGLAKRVAQDFLEMVMPPRDELFTELGFQP